MISEKLNAKDCTGWIHLDFSRKGKPAVTRSSCSQWDEKQELTTGRQEDVLGTQKCSFTGLQGHNTALWQVKAPQNVLTRKLHTRNTYFNKAVWVSTTCEETSRALPQWGNTTCLHYGMATEARLENQPRCTRKTAGNDSTQLSRKNGSFHKSLFFCCIPQPSPLTTFLIPAETLLYVNQTPFSLPGQRSECAIFSFKLYVAARACARTSGGLTVPITLAISSCVSVFLALGLQSERRGPHIFITFKWDSKLFLGASPHISAD